MPRKRNTRDRLAPRQCALYVALVGLFLGVLVAAVLLHAGDESDVRGSSIDSERAAELFALDDLPRGLQLEAKWCLARHRKLDERALEQCARLIQRRTAGSS